MSRRGLMRKAGLVAVAGLGTAAGASALGASPAAAANGDPLVLGQSNQASTMTQLASTDTVTLRVENLVGEGDALHGVAADIGVHGSGGGIGVSGNSSFGFGVRGFSGSSVGVKGESNGNEPAIHGDNNGFDPGGAGVLGTSRFQGVAGVSTEDVGVVGVSEASTARLSPIGVLGVARGTGVEGRGELIGVRATGAVPLHLVPSGTPGAPTGGFHQKGEVHTDANGVLWLCTADGPTGTWVRTITSGENALTGTQQLTVRKSGTGAALYGQVDATTGTAWAVRGHTFGAAEAIYGSIANASNTKAAVRGTTTGPGTAVRGDSDLGRGGQFKGKAAAINLTPNTDATHPTSGAAGDLFVDNSKRLWFCKGGTTWVQVA